jgi:sec-independent protein translocase protein TatA
MQFIASFTGIHTLAWGLPHNGMEWIVIGVIALLIFGKRIPTMARGIGQGIKEFKSGLKSGEQEADAAIVADAKDPAALPKPKFDPQTGKPLDA